MLIFPPVWNADLKPSPPGVAQSDDESGASTPRFPQPQSVLPSFDSQSASGFPGPVPSLQPYTPSIAYTTSSEAADPFYISTPKPDIVVGLEDRNFEPTYRVRLAKHQSLGSILSDPHTAAMGLRFPFNCRDEGFEPEWGSGGCTESSCCWCRLYAKDTG